MTLPLERNIPLGLAAVVVIIAVVGAASLRSAEATAESAGWVAHTLQVRGGLAAAIADLTDAETATRGYVITGDASFLAPYDTARSKIGAVIARLNTLTSDNPDQQRRLDSLAVLIPPVLAQLEQTSELRRRSGAGAAARQVATGRGKALMDDIRREIRQMEVEEDSLLKRRSAVLLTRTRQARLAAWGGPGLALLLAFIASVLANRELAARRGFQEALRDSEERYRMLFDTSPVPTWVFDLDTLAFLAVNDAAVHAYGYTREEFLAKTIADIRPPEDVPALRHAVTEIAAGREGGGPWRHQKMDGTVIDVEITSHVLRYGGRRAELVLARDVTERKRAEEVLRESEERLRLLFENVRDYAIFMLDPTGHVAGWNRGAQQIKGYTPEEIVGRHFSCFYPPEAVAAGRPEASLRAARETGRYEEEDWRVRKDGSRFWADVVITAVRDARGKLVGFAKVTRDLSERKRAEEALRTSEEQFRILAMTANDAIISADSDGHITYFNPGAERMFDYPADQVHAQSLTVLMPERFREAHLAGLTRYLRTREAHVVGRTVELVGRKQDGTEFPLELSLASWARGTDVAFTAVIRDITERKLVDETLRRHTAQLEAANAELNTFAYSVSHDLRAPLRSIDGFSQALLEDCADRLDAAGRDYLQRVRAASQRMATLIDDLLNLSRVTRSEMAIGRVDLSGLAQELAAELLSNEPSRQVQCVIAPGLIVYADPGLMRVVLQNLLGNAWKFTGKRGDARIEVGAVAADGKTAYYVRDNGAGFDMAYAPKLFGAFQRLHGATEFPGTGVGLATVQRIIHRHGGKVWAEAEPDRGATFYFTLS